MEAVFTTDGRQHVWAVFHADGYECSSLIAICSTEAEARKCCERAYARILDDHNRLYRDSPDRPMAEFVEVESWTLNEERPTVCDTCQVMRMRDPRREAQEQQWNSQQAAE